MRSTYICVLLIAIFIAGCSSLPGLPGHVSVSQSDFDKITQISVEPAWIESSPSIKMGLTWRSNWPKDEFVMDVFVMGVESITGKDSLQFNVDGKVHKLSSIDGNTDYSYKEGVYNNIATVPGQSFSSKRYVVTKDFVNSLVNGKDVQVRLVLAKEFVDGVFSYDVPSRAKPAFRNFVAEYDKYRKIN